MYTTDAMYSVWFEGQVHSGNGEPIGKIIDLSDPDIFPAKNDGDAMDKAFQRADVVEYLKSLRLNERISARKFLVRVKTVIRQSTREIIYERKRRKEKKFK